uniref:Uncharacterized protein n=1 Tax=Bionectria ochroleuca TaxID=29856 RepID=A0A8H7TTG9_BIOOC
MKEAPLEPEVAWIWALRDCFIDSLTVKSGLPNPVSSVCVRRQTRLGTSRPRHHVVIFTLHSHPSNTSPFTHLPFFTSSLLHFKFSSTSPSRSAISLCSSQVTCSLGSLLLHPSASSVRFAPIDICFHGIKHHGACDSQVDLSDILSAPISARS